MYDVLRAITILSLEWKIFFHDINKNKRFLFYLFFSVASFNGFSNSKQRRWLKKSSQFQFVTKKHTHIIKVYIFNTKERKKKVCICTCKQQLFMFMILCSMGWLCCWNIFDKSLYFRYISFKSKFSISLFYITVIFIYF